MRERVCAARRSPTSACQPLPHAQPTSARQCAGPLACPGVCWRLRRCTAGRVTLCLPAKFQGLGPAAPVFCCIARVSRCRAAGGGQLWRHALRGRLHRAAGGVQGAAARARAGTAAAAPRQGARAGGARRALACRLAAAPDAGVLGAHTMPGSRVVVTHIAERVERAARHRWCAPSARRRGTQHERRPRPL